MMIKTHVTYDVSSRLDLLLSDYLYVHATQVLPATSPSWLTQGRWPKWKSHQTLKQFEAGKTVHLL